MFFLMFVTVFIAVLRPVPLIIFKGDEPGPKDGIWGNKHFKQSYQAVAHILVGIWVTLYYYQVQYAMQVFWILAAVESICAVMTVALRKRRKR